MDDTVDSQEEALTMQDADPTLEAESSARFILSGSFDPEEITAYVGLSPSHVAKEGELVSPLGEYRRKQSRWEVRSTLDESSPIGDHTRSILEILGPKRQELADLGNRYDAGFECRVYVYDAQGPEMYFDREVVRQISELNAYIDLDVYCLGGDGES